MKETIRMITQKEIDVEVWKLVDTTKNLHISNMGRVKRIYANGSKPFVGIMIREAIV